MAFVISTPSEERDEYLVNIWMVDVAGGEPRRFTTGPTRDTVPRWSPDGRWLAFLSDRGAKKKAQLHVMPADGGEANALTDLPNGVLGLLAPAWSPDSTRLAFTALVGGWHEPERPEERGKSKPARVITSMKYKAEGFGLTNDLWAHVFTVSRSGGPPTQLTSGEFDHGAPTWSPDGASIAIVAERHATRESDVLQGLYVIPAAGGEPRLVTPTLRRMWSPRFSPDGRAIAHLGMRLPQDGHNFVVYVQPIDGGDALCASETLDRSASDQAPLAWSPDGEWILFVGRDHGTNPLYRVRAKGGDVPTAIVGGRRCVIGFSIARETGAVAFTAGDGTSLPEVSVCRADGSEERRLTDLNHEWKTEVEFSNPERFSFTRAGYEIDGWVMRPVPFDPAKRYPALLWIHGGPHREFSDIYTHEFQVHAAAGCAIVYFNPRGSQGYGEAFSRACVGDWGGEDYADLMVGVDEALGRYPFIDGERLGVIGVSYGGYMTSWTVGHTDRFKAACSEAGISSVATQVGTSDIGFWWTIDEQGGVPPWEDPERYRKHSPLTYVQNIRTPMLIIHGESDARCHIIESEQLFVALKKLGREAVFIRVTDAGHGYGALGRPRQRLERYRIILDWFAKHLACDSVRR